MPQKVVVIQGREPEGRIDPITGSEVIISAARSMREGKKKSEAAYKLEDMPERENNCPFCPGNEEMTTPELVRIREGASSVPVWSARGFTNLYPAIALEAKGPKDSSNPALGVHEVIVETPCHNGFLSSLPIHQIAQAIIAVTERYFSLRGDPRLEWFSFFKNFGRQAGASIDHPHFQIAVKARISKKFRGRFHDALEYFWNTGRYLCCDEIERHRRLGHIVLESDLFIVYVPYEARLPYHMRIFPKKHQPSFAHMFRSNEKARMDFVDILRKTVLLFKIAVQGEKHESYSDPMYNFYIETAPYREDHREGILHWRVEFLGKTTIEAGYEQITGEFINPTYPEEVAAQLKEIASVYLK